MRSILYSIISKIKKLQNKNSEIEEEYQELYDAMAKTTGTGTYITLNNTAKGKMPIEVSGNTEQTTYTGKNLFNKDNYVWSDNTVVKYNPIYVGDGTFTLSSPNMPIFNEGKNMFILAGNVSIGASSGTNGVDKDTPRTVTSVDGYITIANRYILGQDTGVYHPQDYDWMLEKSSTATSYEPYVGGTASPNPDYPQDVRVVTEDNTIKVTNEDETEEQTFPLNLGDIELCKIGDYKDYIYKNDDKWYVKKNISKIVLDGSENWSDPSTNRFNIDGIIPDNNYLKNNNITYYCNNYKGYRKTDTNASFNTLVENENYGFNFTNNINNNTIRIKDTRYTLLTDFETWLSTHNTIVYYVLETPTDIEIPDTTLINQLEAIYNTAKSYKGQTHIFTVTEDGNVAPNLDVTALLDLNSIINS